MEPAKDLLARQLPPLNHHRGTPHESVSAEKLAAEYMFPWSDFIAQILTALGSLDLHAHVSLTDPAEGEKYVVGNKLGLTARIIHNICDPVAKALSVTSLSGLRFCDIQAITTSDGIPDVVGILDSLASGQRPKMVAVGEVKPFWLVYLDDYPITLPPNRRRPLEHHMGQLVSYMREHSLKYGFLTTYSTTIFVKRTDSYRFLLSAPIDKQATHPSVRECFAGFSVLANEDPKFEEEESVTTSSLRAIPPVQVSLRSSLYREITSHEALQPSISPSGLASYNITRESIIVGGDGIAQYAVNVVKKISGKNWKQRKAIFEVELGGVRCIAKCWAPELLRNYVTESSVYKALHAKQPQGYSMFPKLVAYGQILFSSMFPDRLRPQDSSRDPKDPLGHILILEKVDGEPLSDLWTELSPREQQHVKEECYAAIATLRLLPVYIADAGKYNVLFSRQTQTVKMLDFETADVCDHAYPASNLLGPEMISLFGPGNTALFRSSGG